MNKAVWLVTFSALLFAACGQSALLQMRRDNEASEVRIDSKERELQAHEHQRTALLNEQKELLAEMETKQLTLLDLHAKLDQLRKKNGEINADNAAQQREKDSLDLQLRRYQADIAGLQKNDRLPADEKRKRIEDLKKQISAHLKLMLAL